MSPSAVRAAAERAGPCAPKAVLLALRYSGIRLLLVRRTYQELENNHIRFLRAQLAGIAAYRAADRRFVFPGGSTLEFGYCACDGDLDRYQGCGIRCDFHRRGDAAS